MSSNDRIHYSIWFTVKGKLVDLNWKLKNFLLATHRRSKLKNQDFTIISSNCVGGLLYEYFGLPYFSPTVGMFFFAEDYMRFLQNFNHYINQPLTFVENSKYSQLVPIGKKYPIGTVGDGIEIHFMHYRSKEDVSEKWERRKKRINLDNLFVIYTDRDLFREEHLKMFIDMPFKNKIFLSSKPRGYENIVVYVEDYKDEIQVGESEHNLKYAKYFDFIKWLNGEPNFMKKHSQATS